MIQLLIWVIRDAFKANNLESHLTHRRCLAYYVIAFGLRKTKFIGFWKVLLHQFNGGSGVASLALLVLVTLGSHQGQKGSARRLHDNQTEQLCTYFTKKSSWLILTTPMTIYASHSIDQNSWCIDTDRKSEILVLINSIQLLITVSFHSFRC